jgi:transposase
MWRGSWSSTRKKLRQISEAKGKADRLDARRRAELLAAGYLAEVWCPDERTRALRRLVARRAQLVRQRARAKNESAAALQRNLLDRPGVYDVAGERGRIGILPEHVAGKRRGHPAALR